MLLTNVLLEERDLKQIIIKTNALIDIVLEQRDSKRIIVMKTNNLTEIL